MYSPLDRHGGTMMMYTYPDSAIKSYKKEIKKLKEEIDILKKENLKLKKENEFLLEGIICKTSKKAYAEFNKS